MLSMTVACDLRLWILLPVLRHVKSRDQQQDHRMQTRGKPIYDVSVA